MSTAWTYGATVAHVMRYRRPDGGWDSLCHAGPTLLWEHYADTTDGMPLWHAAAPGEGPSRWYRDPETPWCAFCARRLRSEVAAVLLGPDAIARVHRALDNVFADRPQAGTGILAVNAVLALRRGP